MLKPNLENSEHYFARAKLRKYSKGGMEKKKRERERETGGILKMKQEKKKNSRLCPNFFQKMLSWQYLNYFQVEKMILINSNTFNLFI